MSDESCPVCFEDRDLFIIPCGNVHAFCFACILQLGGAAVPQQLNGAAVSQQLSFSCPVCRKHTVIPRQGVAALPLSYPVSLSEQGACEDVSVTGVQIQER